MFKMSRFLTCFLSQRPSKDVNSAGYKTTIGPAEFHEPKLNRLNFQLLLNKSTLLKGCPGRKPKVRKSLIHFSFLIF